MVRLRRRAELLMIKRLLLALLALTCFSVDVAHARTGATRAAALYQPLFLDGQTDVVFTASVRRVRTAYTGALLNIRRSSDNATQDFGTGQPQVYWADVSTFIGGGTAFIVTWYDQSGNGRNLTQATAANQPSLVNASNSRPAVLGDGVSSYMTTASFSISQPLTFYSVYRRVTLAQSSFENLFEGQGSSNDPTFYYSNGPTIGPSMWAGNQFGSNTTAQPTGTRGATSGVFNNASSIMEVNSSSISSFTGTTSTTNLSGGLIIFTNFNHTSTRFDNTELQELTFFNTGRTSAVLKVGNSNMRAWFNF